LAGRPGGYCYWHDPAADKSGPEVRPKLEAEVASGRSLEGFNLRGADLENVRLTHGYGGLPTDLRNADLSRANLRNAHMFNCDLRGATMLKAGLREATLNHAQLEGANLLGADLRDTRIEQVHWGRYLAQHRAALQMYRQRRRLEASQLFGEAEEVYRNISLELHRRGHANKAGQFYIRQMVMRRKQMPPWSKERFLSWLVDMLCGYGERADRVIGFSLTVIFGCGLAYFLAGVEDHLGNPVGLSTTLGALDNLFEYLTCVYFSLITFTTAGYGDILPQGPIRALAATEAFVGAFSMSLFVVVFVKRMTR
jgi:hypothetical protein